YLTTKSAKSTKKESGADEGVELNGLNRVNEVNGLNGLSPRGSEAPSSDLTYLTHLTLTHAAVPSCMSLCSLRSLWLKIFASPTHQVVDEGDDGGVVGEDDGDVFGADGAVPCPFGHHFHGATAGAVNERGFAFRAVGPESADRDGLVLDGGFEDRFGVMRTIDRDVVAGAVAEEDQKVLARKRGAVGA